VSGNEEKSRVLVVSGTQGLAEMVKEAVRGNLEVIHASDLKEGLEKARKELPDMVVLGHIEPQGSAFELHHKLGQGWITRSIPLLVVDTSSLDHTPGVLSMEEGLQMEADEYVTLSADGDRSSASQLAEPIARLRERLDARLK
jgi:DNA-binding response OmpR family regulator